MPKIASAEGGGGVARAGNFERKKKGKQKDSENDGRRRGK
jgi:hypothetical protein